jgi:uncharacterized protein YukE
MDFQVNTSDLEGIAGVFSSAGSDVAHLRAVLAGQGAGPESAGVIGSAGAASKYADLLGQWTHALDQLASSLDTMSRKVQAVAVAYAQTEAANTAPAGP